jgi:hypothetical protein
LQDGGCRLVFVVRLLGLTEILGLRGVKENRDVLLYALFWGEGGAEVSCTV